MKKIFNCKFCSGGYTVMKGIFIPFFIILIFTNCNPDRIFKKYIKIPAYQWYYKNKINFEIKIEDTVSKYNIKVPIRFMYGFPYRNLNITMTKMSPSSAKDGEIAVTYPSIQIRDEHGKYLGEVIGDIGDVVATVETNVIFPEKGLYQIKLEHNMDTDPVHMIMEIGLIVEKAKKE